MLASLRALTFAKYEGAGNDFVVLDCADEAQVATSFAKQLCERNFGIGADGVLLVLPPQGNEALARMRVINADGSIPEMCGNGLRCVALHLARRGGAPFLSSEVLVETDAGLRRCLVEREDTTAQVMVDMGELRALGDRILQLEQAPYTVVLVDAGNPHAILFGTHTAAEVQRLGPQIATHESFLSGTNVEFASVREGHIELVVWERGVGITQACGTGACATALAAWNRQLLPRVPTEVRLPGGVLHIAPGPGTRVTMKGPARLVFHGTWQGRQA